MASKKGKKVVNQEELRRLMREKQRQSSDKKRVESPFAKYSSLGHLSCVLCAVQLKSELLWPAHVLGKAHKEKVAELKISKQAPPPQTATAAAAKRKAPEERDGGGGGGSKRPKSADAAPSEPSGGAAQRSAGLTLLAGCYDQEDDDDDDEEAAGGAETTPTQTATTTPEGLPADFFDSSIPAATPAISHSGSILKAEPADKSADKKENTAEALPEGFFDDPVRDAKVRNVDAPKDQMDKEWEEFQKEIRQVNTKSEAIVAEDDEEGRLGRQIDEIDEQIECLRRVEVLRDRRDVVRSRTQTGKPGSAAPAPDDDRDQDQDDEEEEDDDDDEELLGLLSRDWRAKGALA